MAEAPKFHTKVDKMLKNTKEKMLNHAQTLKPGSDRARCYHIANLAAGSSIAEALENDHHSLDGSRRAAVLMCEAGAATHDLVNGEHCYGIFTFEDGSKMGKKVGA